MAQRAIHRAKARGTPIDTDPAFLSLLEEWILGEIDMKAMRNRYLDITALRVAELRDRRDSSFSINRSEPPDWANEE